LASLDAGSWFILFAIADIPTTQNDFLRDDYVENLFLSFAALRSA
jgi:hypothetical protein